MIDRFALCFLYLVATAAPENGPVYVPVAVVFIQRNCGRSTDWNVGDLCTSDTNTQRCELPAVGWFLYLRIERLSLKSSFAPTTTAAKFLSISASVTDAKLAFLPSCSTYVRVGQSNFVSRVSRESANSAGIQPFLCRSVQIFVQIKLIDAD